MKLISKERLGSRVKKLYDSPRTPYQRVLDSPHVAAPDKETLRRQYQQFNPAALKRELRKLQKQLFAYAKNKPRLAPPKRRAYHQNLEIKPHPEL
jgi:hypothetical protein